MSKISTTDYARAFSKQKALTDQQWLDRCDELAQEQRMLFLELLTFLRDGVPEKQGRGLIDYLSILQFVAKSVSKTVAEPVGLPEFQEAIKRATQFFYAMTTHDPGHEKRMVQAWYEGLTDSSEPVLWAGCIKTLKEPGLLDHRLGEGMVVTLYAITNVFCKRLEILR